MVCLGGQSLQYLILVLPEGVQPLLEGLFELAIIGVVTSHPRVYLFDLQMEVNLR